MTNGPVFGRGRRNLPVPDGRVHGARSGVGALVCAGVISFLISFLIAFVLTVVPEEVTGVEIGIAPNLVTTLVRNSVSAFVPDLVLTFVLNIVPAFVFDKAVCIVPDNVSEEVPNDVSGLEPRVALRGRRRGFQPDARSWLIVRELPDISGWLSPIAQTIIRGRRRFGSLAGRRWPPCRARKRRPLRYGSGQLKRIRRIRPAGSPACP